MPLLAKLLEALAALVGLKVGFLEAPAVYYTRYLGYMASLLIYNNILLANTLLIRYFIITIIIINLIIKALARNRYILDKATANRHSDMPLWTNAKYLDPDGYALSLEYSRHPGRGEIPRR